jgi:hypothetical protein
MPFPAESIPDRESGGMNGWKRSIPLAAGGAIDIASSVSIKVYLYSISDKISFLESSFLSLNVSASVPILKASGMGKDSGGI